nr:MAG TPA: hypothetical protein [Caudoviricetes sp.]
MPVFFYAKNAGIAPIGAAKKGKCGRVFLINRPLAALQPEPQADATRVKKRSGRRTK